MALLFLSCSTKKSGVDLELVPVSKGGYWGYIDQAGKFAVNPQFKNAYAFQDGLAMVVTTSGKYGFIGPDGKIRIQPVYKDARGFSENLACVVKEDQSIEFIRTDGTTAFMLDKEIDKSYSFSEGLALVMSNGKYGYVDKQGKLVIPCQYTYAGYFSEGLAGVTVKEKDKNKTGFIDREGKMVIPPQFEGAYGFSDGMCLIVQNDKYGFIDREGKIAIAPQYEDANGFSEGRAAVKQGELWGYINREGRFAINPQFKEAGGFNGKLAAVKSTANAKWGFIDQDGRTVIEPQFESVTGFIDGIAVSQLGEHYGVIDGKGKYRVNPQFDDYQVSHSPFYAVESDFFDGALVARMLVNEATSAAFKGIRPGIDFTAMKEIYPDMTHENHSFFYTYGSSEENRFMRLQGIGVQFEEGFENFEAKYKYEDRFNYWTASYETKKVFDKYETTYNDRIPVKGCMFRYALTGKALEKSASLLKAIHSHLPAQFRKELEEDKYLLFYNDSYFVRVVINKEHLVATVAFARSSFNNEFVSAYADMSPADTTTTVDLNP